MKTRELVKLLKKNGWIFVRHGGNHDVYTNGSARESIPRHSEIDEDDFEINTEGETQADAMYMARDAIGAVGIDMIENGEDLPTPTSFNKVKETNPEDIVTLVDINFDAYRKRLDKRTVRKNCTIPKWLNEEAERKGINFSSVLQDGLKDRLGYKY